MQLTAAVPDAPPSTEDPKPIGLDARKGDGRHESKLADATERHKAPVVNVLVTKATELPAPRTPAVSAEIGTGRAAPALPESFASEDLRGGRDLAGVLLNGKSRDDAAESGDRDANREARRDTAEQAPSVHRSIASAPFVERAELREAGSPSQVSRPALTLVHGTAPIVTQATLLQPPMVATSDAPATSTPAPDTAERIVQSLKLQVQKGGGDAVLHLQPDHLGPVAISLRVENGAVTAVITAEHPAVAEWLQSNQQSLREGLQSSGLNLERFVVQRDGQSPSDRQRREWVESRRRDFRRREPQSDSTFEISV